MDSVDRADMDINFLIERECKNICNAVEEYSNSDVVDERYCVDCGEPIPIGRLKAIPSACRCISCQTTYEQEKVFRYGRRK